MTSRVRITSVGNQRVRLWKLSQCVITGLAAQDEVAAKIFLAVGLPGQVDRRPPLRSRSDPSASSAARCQRARCTRGSDGSLSTRCAPRTAYRAHVIAALALVERGTSSGKRERRQRRAIDTAEPGLPPMVTPAPRGPAARADRARCRDRRCRALALWRVGGAVGRRRGRPIVERRWVRTGQCAIQQEAEQAARRLPLQADTASLHRCAHGCDLVGHGRHRHVDDLARRPGDAASAERERPCRSAAALQDPAARRRASRRGRRPFRRPARRVASSLSGVSESWIVTEVPCSAPVFGSGTTVPLRSEGSASRATGIVATSVAIVENGTWSGEVAVGHAPDFDLLDRRGLRLVHVLAGTVTVTYTSLPTRRARRRPRRQRACGRTAEAADLSCRTRPAARRRSVSALNAQRPTPNVQNRRCRFTSGLLGSWELDVGNCHNVYDERSSGRAHRQPRRSRSAGSGVRPRAT